LADARVGIDGSQIMVQFDVLDADYNPLGQEIGFWMNDGAHPFETTLKVEKMSVMDMSSKHFSLGILGLALVGGLLLNLMPCVFPVLSLKLMAFTRFGGLNEAKIRRNFGLNSLGILSAFGLMAVVLAALKAMGYVLGWGMQFQNIYFMVAIIWVVTLFLAQVLGFINLKTPQLPTKVLQKTAVREKWFEFLSGVFLVVLSTPCMAPYLGTAFSVALAGNVAEIMLTVLCVGLGVACPYLLICAVPSVAAHLPKPGKWLNTVQVLMVVMLLITLVWLVSVLASQTAAVELWHWAIYIVLALVVLFFYKTVRLEIDKVEDRQLIVPLLRRFGRIFWGILIVLIGVSLFDVVQTAEKSRVVDNVSKVLTINEALIKENVAAGGPVLVKVGAGWCLTCRYNDALVFDEEAVQDMLTQKNVMIIDVDWTRYNAEVLKFMQKFGRHGLPFYVLFSKAYPNGVVLSELPSAEELSVLLEM
jgi:suppressor for copper-sensitivity B